MAPHTFPDIAVVNEATSGLTDGDVLKMVAAIQKQITEDFGPVWGYGARLHFCGLGVRPARGMWVVAILGNSDVAGALGYHDLTPDGFPLGKVFAGTDRQYGQASSATLSHEILELLVDPYINTAAQGADGSFYALEVADAVEADELGYEIDGVLVSDFVTPHWFGNGHGPMDHLGHVRNPYQLAPGGYISCFDPASGQGWVQLTARKADASDLDLFLARPRVGSRRERRFTPSHLWVPSTFEQGDPVGQD